MMTPCDPPVLLFISLMFGAGVGCFVLGFVLGLGKR